MGRITQQDPLSSNQILSSINAGEDIKAGDLITQTTAGNAYWANDPAHPLAQLRPVYQASDINLQPLGSPIIAATASYSGTFDSDGSNAILLDDGAFVVGFVQTGTTVRDVWFSIYNKDLSVRVAKVRVAGNTDTQSGQMPITVNVHKLPGNNFMLVFRGQGNGPMFAIYASDGTLVKAATSIETVTGTAWSSTVLNNGAVAIVYTVGTGSAVKYAVVSQAGDIVQAGTQIGSFGMETAMSVAVCALTDGGFAVAWNAGKLQKFTAAGVAVGAAINVYGGGTATNSYMHIYCIPLANGGVAVVSDVYAACYVYSSNLVLLATIGMPGLYATSNQQNCYCSAAAGLDGGMFLAWVVSGNSSQTIGYSKVSSTGVVLNTGVTSATITVGGGNGMMYRAVAGPDGGLLVLTTGQIALFDAGMNLQGIRNLPVVQPHSGGSVRAVWMVDTNNPLLYNILFVAGGGVGGAYPTSLQSCTFLAPTRIPLGVALSDAKKGTPVTFVAVGSARTRLTYIKPFTIDATASLAQKFSALGNLAIMRGIQ